MRLALVCCAIALLAGNSAMAAQDCSRTGSGDFREPTGVATQAAGPADVLIAMASNGNFTDLSPDYEAAFLAAGAASVTSIIDGPDSPFSFPSPFTSAEYGTVVVLTAENWWGEVSTAAPEANVSLTDEAALSAYMDTGGAMFFSGQDYLFARGGSSGFPQVYLGIASHIDDPNFGDTSMTYIGTPGGPLDGLTGSLSNANPPAPPNPCWITDNQFFTDEITPFGTGLLFWSSNPSGTFGEGGCAWDTGVYRSVFSTVELACADDTAQFHAAVSAIYDFLRASATPVAETSWGALKSQYK